MTKDIGIKVLNRIKYVLINKIDSDKIPAGKSTYQ